MAHDEEFDQFDYLVGLLLDPLTDRFAISIRVQTLLKAQLPVSGSYARVGDLVVLSEEALRSIGGAKTTQELLDLFEEHELPYGKEEWKERWDTIVARQPF